MLIYKTY